MIIMSPPQNLGIYGTTPIGLEGILELELYLYTYYGYINTKRFTDTFNLILHVC